MCGPYSEKKQRSAGCGLGVRRRQDLRKNSAIRKQEEFLVGFEVWRGVAASKFNQVGVTNL